MKKYLVAVFLASLVFVPVVAYAAQTTPSPSRLETIRHNCTVIQTILDQLQRRDLVTRTNRGRAYEAQIKQIDALQQRMVTNHIVTSAVEPRIAQFKTNVETFREAYVAYDDRMKAIRLIDCREKPDIFATALDDIRKLREQLGAEVIKTENTLAQYRQTLIDVRATLPDARSNQ
jgi:uncharacterized DUF497 family protein